MDPEDFDTSELDELTARAKREADKHIKWGWFIGLWTVFLYWLASVTRLRLAKTKIGKNSLAVFDHSGRCVYLGEPEPGEMPFSRHMHVYDIEGRDFTADWNDAGHLEVKRAH